MRGIIFDLDDTLYPRELFVRSGFAAVASHVADGWRISRDVVLGTLRHAHEHGQRGFEFQALCAEHRLPLSIIPMLVQSFRMHRPCITLQPSVSVTLQHLRRHGWKLGILTNGDPAVQRRKVDALGLNALVDSVTYAEEHAAGGKPNPMAFMTALQRLDVPRSQCVHVGDDPVCDVVGAHAAGLRAIRVLAPPDWPSDEEENTSRWFPSEADAIVDTVLDVATVAPLMLMEASRDV